MSVATLGEMTASIAHLHPGVLSRVTLVLGDLWLVAQDGVHEVEG